jgi:hypothetical protein
MHQLGSRIFPLTKNIFKLVKFQWEYEFKKNLGGLKQNIIDVLKSKQLVIRYFSKNGNNEIYGIVSSSFQEINQLEFRESFINELKQLDDFSVESKLTVNRNGQLIEEFIPAFSQQQVAYTYCLIHGNNNGYNAIKMFWGRKVIICSNGLTRYKDADNFILNHTQSSNSKTFVQQTVEEGIKNYNFINNRIETSSNSILQDSTFNDFLGGITLARATKDRIADRLKTEVKVTGNTEWSLSQSLTWLAEHEKAIGTFTKNLLRDTGTFILEEGLEKFMSEKRVVEEFNQKYIIYN